MLALVGKHFGEELESEGVPPRGRDGTRRQRHEADLQIIRDRHLTRQYLDDHVRLRLPPAMGDWVNLMDCGGGRRFAGAVCRGAVGNARHRVCLSDEHRGHEGTFSVYYGGGDQFGTGVCDCVGRPDFWG